MAIPGFGSSWRGGGQGHFMGSEHREEMPWSPGGQAEHASSVSKESQFVNPAAVVEIARKIAEELLPTTVVSVKFGQAIS
jgi:hypothetical protein